MIVATSSIVNIAAYKFVALHEPAALRAPLLALCKQLQLKGTILLSPEGINLFLAGSRAAIDQIVAHLRSDLRFADLPIKESLSSTPPFKRMLVKLKTEIITMKQAQIQPLHASAPRVDAQTVKRWLDAGCDDRGQPVLMLDTRNAFEVDAGSFHNTVDYRLASFSEFPAALERHATELAGKTVVAFCTGGIRCEKAVLLMHQQGLSDVYQLDGGILKYFEEVGGAHYDGNCFVFDQRTALDPQLQPQVATDSNAVI